MTQPDGGRPGLLVSVRSAREAAAALEGGADLIDVKEPDRGSLGRATDDVIAEVLAVVARRCPVSAALGELLEGTPLPSAIRQLAYVKWGLADCRDRDWRSLLQKEFSRLAERAPNCQPVVVAYADHLRASAPHPEDICTFVENHKGAVLLLDTWQKDGIGLLTWVLPSELQLLCRRLHASARAMALAGSLDAEQVCRLRFLCPNWFAVRGAACTGGRRQAEIEPEKVRALVSLLR